MFEIGTAVHDRRARALGRIGYIERIPRSRDLFGHRIPAHRRYTVVFEDGRWANDRTESDLAVV